MLSDNLVEKKRNKKKKKRKCQDKNIYII